MDYSPKEILMAKLFSKSNSTVKKPNIKPQLAKWSGESAILNTKDILTKTSCLTVSSGTIDIMV